MELQLKNIGMIKEANVKLDGLTVIAGENDTGKSTVGKALFSLHMGIYYTIAVVSQNKNENIFKINPDPYYRLLFHEPFLFKQSIILRTEQAEYHSDIHASDEQSQWGEEMDPDISGFIFIESPLVWSFTDFFRDTAQVESQVNIKLNYPFIFKDLNFKLFIKSAEKGFSVKDEVISLMKGEFKKDEMGRYFFERDKQRIELVNTATGIKYFGLFQVLSQNNWLNENTVLVLDEPEVHLHPKWQLEMAKIIVELVKKGVKIVVNSHSPYMIQALIKYARDGEIVDDSNFYLATKPDGFATFENVNDDLNKIFALLSEPMNEVFEL